MWFESDFSWKIVGLDYASFLDKPATLPRSTSRYAAPEILRAVDKDVAQAQLPSAADMWSFGIMTFEILTRMPLDLAPPIAADLKQRMA